jgi:hypothetical protein
MTRFAALRVARAACVRCAQAEKHQKNSKMMLCIYLLLVLCGAMAVVLVIKKSMSRK